MIAAPTKAAAISGIGWSNGMAAQVSLPSMLVLRPRGYARVGSPGLWARSRRQFLCDDLLEQLGIGCTEGERTCVHARPGQGRVAPGIEGWTGVARALDPGGELLRRHRVHVEMHVRETIAAIVARKAAEGAWCIRAQVQLRPHAVHRVDHAAELWDEEGVHHTPRGQGEVQRH